jgi:hypothetical protein
VHPDEHLAGPRFRYRTLLDHERVVPGSDDGAHPADRTPWFGGRFRR